MRRLPSSELATAFSFYSDNFMSRALFSSSVTGEPVDVPPCVTEEPGNVPRDRPLPPPRPNHFLSLRIRNESIWQNIAMIQATALQQQPELIPCKIKPSDLHLTLFVLCLRDKLDVDAAKACVATAEKVVHYDFYALCTTLLRIHYDLIFLCYVVFGI